MTLFAVPYPYSLKAKYKLPKENPGHYGFLVLPETGPDLFLSVKYYLSVSVS